jgi:hypothetical protein
VSGAAIGAAAHQAGGAPASGAAAHRVGGAAARRARPRPGRAARRWPGLAARRPEGCGGGGSCRGRQWLERWKMKGVPWRRAVKSCYLRRPKYGPSEITLCLTAVRGPSDIGCYVRRPAQAFGHKVTSDGLLRGRRR